MPLQFVSANGSANGSIRIHFSDFFNFPCTILVVSRSITFL